MKGYSQRTVSVSPGAQEADHGPLPMVKTIALPLALTAPMLCLGIVNLAWQISRPPGPIQPPRGVIYLLSLDAEGNVATWYASSLLLIVCLLLAVIWVATRAMGDSYAWYWGTLSATFAFLSLDEAIGLHERTIVPLRVMLGTSGWFYWAWVIPAMVLVLLYGLASLPFLAHLPARSRALFVLSGLLYVGGALGVEMLSGQIRDTFGLSSMHYALATTFEEILEMAGTILFVYALLDYARLRRGELGFRLAGVIDNA